MAEWLALLTSDHEVAGKNQRSILKGNNFLPVFSKWKEFAAMGANSFLLKKRLLFTRGLVCRKANKVTKVNSFHFK